MAIRHAWTPRVVVPTLVLASVGAGLLSELGRIVIKGADYGSRDWQDYHYYTGMAQRLWQAPMDLHDEIALLGLRFDPITLVRTYTPGSFHSLYVHAVDGVSHQPPFAYRVVQPTAAGLLHGVGISLDLAFLLLYLLGIALVAVFAFGLMSPRWQVSARAVVVTAGVTVATLATSRPVIPDALFLGLAMLAVWAAARHRPWLFAVAACAAMGTRETALVLPVAWVAYAWSRWRGRWPALVLPALAPLVVLLGIHLVVDVPDSSVDVAGILDRLVSPRNAGIALGALLTIGLMSPLMARFTRPSSRVSLSRAELLVWLTGAAATAVMASLATNTARMALLVMPMFVAPSGWQGARSRLWLLAAGAATFGYAAADTLAARDPAPFGQYPWLVTAVVVVALQVAALRSDRRAASPAG
jgi:hypothetical protein